MQLPLVLLYSRKQMPGNLQGHIKFDNVDFHYPSDLRKYALRGMAWEVKAGQKVGVCGTAGCGKSTCFELLCRLYNPDSTGGRILVDGVDISKYDVHFLRRRICMVAQKTVLFKTSVRENLWYGLPSYPGDAKIEEACRAAQIWEDLQKKPDKLLTMINDDGGGFSGGQEQRLAITRLILRKPDVILLDEATAALDPVNERKVQDSLDTLMKNTTTTTLAIAHRLTTIKDSDLILVLKEGKVVEQGRHTDLVKKDVQKETDADGNEKVTAGFYRNQWDTQFQETDTSTQRLREKIEELQYQIRVHESEIAVSNAKRFDAMKKSEVMDLTPALPALDMLRARTAMSKGPAAGLLPAIDMERAQTSATDPAAARPRLQRGMSAHNQVY